MAFAETLKLAVKRKAHFCCCLCHAVGVEVHHIVPQAGEGDDSDENAAPLCPSCHETYGANAQKRKFIREARDFWYELCAKIYATDPDRLAELSEKLNRAVTRGDLDDAVSRIVQLIRTEAANEARPVHMRAQEVARLGSMIAPDIEANRRCSNCGTTIGLYIGDQGRCPTCGNPW